MDPITHGLIGASIAVLSGHPTQLNDPVFLGATLGAMAPDLDIIAHAKGRLNYLLKHRGASHSLLALGGIAVILSAALFLLLPATPWATILLWTMAGVLSHGIIDLLNSYGAKLLWPFLNKRLTVNMVMLTDPVIFITFLLAFLVSMSTPVWGQEAVILALAMNVVYLLLRQIGRWKVRKVLTNNYYLKDSNAVKVIPAMYRPFNWNFILLEKDIVRFGTLRKNIPVIHRVLPRWDTSNPYVVTALDGALAEVFDEFSSHYHIVAEQSHNECKIEFLDLRYWAKGEFIYTGKVMINSEGEICEETFYPFQNDKGILLGC